MLCLILDIFPRYFYLGVGVAVTLITLVLLVLGFGIRIPFRYERLVWKALGQRNDYAFHPGGRCAYLEGELADEISSVIQTFLHPGLWITVLILTWYCGIHATHLLDGIKAVVSVSAKDVVMLWREVDVRGAHPSDGAYSDLHL